MVKVKIRDNNVDAALKYLRKIVNQEEILKKLRQKRAYYKPSEQKVINEKEAIMKRKMHRNYLRNMR